MFYTSASYLSISLAANVVEWRSVSWICLVATCVTLYSLIPVVSKSSSNIKIIFWYRLNVWASFLNYYAIMSIRLQLNIDLFSADFVDKYHSHVTHSRVNCVAREWDIWHGNYQIRYILYKRSFLVTERWLSSLEKMY